MADLMQLTAELMAIPSVSLGEKAIADHVEAMLSSASWLDVARVGDNVVARTELNRPTRVCFAGHLDTVPANGNEAPRCDGETLWGLGSADMKGGLAVMADLALSVPEPRHDLTFIFYAAEEIDRARSGLLQLSSARPDLVGDIDVAVVCEPTSARVEAGCQGMVKAEVTVTGESAHVARPWAGDNAVHRLGPVIAAISAWPGREVSIEGCTYRESLQAVGVSGGGAWNVLPNVAKVRVNYRFAPDLDVASASERVRQVVARQLGENVTLEVVDSAPAAPPSLGHPVLADLVQSSGGHVAAKLGWTDVAFFAEMGIAAANFGPGDSEVAHKADERVTRSSLERARTVLGLLAGAP